MRTHQTEGKLDGWRTRFVRFQRLLPSTLFALNQATNVTRSDFRLPIRRMTRLDRARLGTIANGEDVAQIGGIILGRWGRGQRARLRPRLRGEGKVGESLHTCARGCCA